MHLLVFYKNKKQITRSMVWIIGMLTAFPCRLLQGTTLRILDSGDTQYPVTRVSFLDGHMVERCFHADAITTSTYFDTVYSVLLTKIFIHYAIVCKEKAQHINIQDFNHN
jgi:hypothetical protein